MTTGDRQQIDTIQVFYVSSEVPYNQTCIQYSYSHVIAIALSSILNRVALSARTEILHATASSSCGCFAFSVRVQRTGNEER